MHYPTMLYLFQENTRLCISWVFIDAGLQDIIMLEYSILMKLTGSLRTAQILNKFLPRYFLLIENLFISFRYD